MNIITEIKMDSNNFKLALMENKSIMAIDRTGLIPVVAEINQKATEFYKGDITYNIFLKDIQLKEDLFYIGYLRNSTIQKAITEKEEGIKNESC